jgi:hypothetical protein
MGSVDRVSSLIYFKTYAMGSWPLSLCVSSPMFMAKKAAMKDNGS